MDEQTQMMIDNANEDDGLLVELTSEMEAKITERVNAKREKKLKNSAMKNNQVAKPLVTLVDLNSTVNSDYHLESVVDNLNAEINPDINNSSVTLVTSVTASNDEALSGNQKVTETVTLVTGIDFDGSINPNEQPDDDHKSIEVDRPCYGVYDDFSEFGKPGVWYHGVKSEKNGDMIEFDEWICAPLHIDAGSCDQSDSNYGLLLRFKNRNYRWKTWLMPLEMLKGSGEDLRGQLLNNGLTFDIRNSRFHLPNYLLSRRPSKQLECALKIGWHDECFVLPNQVIGNRDDIFFQSDHAITAEYQQKGKLKDWQSNISRYCIGNPLLIFQTSIGFAGALLKKCHLDYIGFHIFGDSSTGKSTGHKIAASIWGGESFRKSWKSTSNGLEAAAVLYNDGLLALDELGDSDPREVNQIVYALGNGTGKQRANIKGTARSVHKWRIALLSNGEKTLESHFNEKGLTVKAGQSIRLLEVPVFGNHGAFDNLHGMKDGRHFSDTLQTNVTKHYGTAGIEYLNHLVNDASDFGELHDAALKSFEFTGIKPQESRAARAFALVALAGELATQYGITAWSEGASIEATKLCFQKWREHRGRGNSEDKAILDSLRGFIERYSDSRFTEKGKDHQTNSVRSGWYSDTDEIRTYYLTLSGLKDAIPGFDRKRIVEALVANKWLNVSFKGEPTKQFKIDGRNMKLYEVTIHDA